MIITLISLSHNYSVRRKPLPLQWYGWERVIDSIQFRKDAIESRASTAGGGERYPRERSGFRGRGVSAGNGFWHQGFCFCFHGCVCGRGWGWGWVEGSTARHGSREGRVGCALGTNASIYCEEGRLFV